MLFKKKKVTPIVFNPRRRHFDGYATPKNNLHFSNRA
jgi:hypothetical protein